MSRRNIATHATAMAIRARQRAGAGLASPVNPFDACSKLNVEVRFANIPSMEGMLARSPRPTIIVSSVRPPGRQAFTCAHELGHLVLGHDSVVDDLLTEAPLGLMQEDEDEFAADQFAAFFLMPKTAVVSSLKSREIDPKHCNAIRLLELAGWFGVGYTTLVAHLCYGLQLIDRQRYSELRRLRPGRLREVVLGAECPGLSIVDEHWTQPTVDIRRDDAVWFKHGVDSDLPTVSHPDGGSVIRPTMHGVHAVRARRLGALAVRVMKPTFEGRSIYRYLGEDDDDSA